MNMDLKSFEEETAQMQDELKRRKMLLKLLKATENSKRSWFETKPGRALCRVLHSTTSLFYNMNQTAYDMLNNPNLVKRQQLLDESEAAINKLNKLDRTNEKKTKEVVCLMADLVMRSEDFLEVNGEDEDLRKYIDMFRTEIAELRKNNGLCNTDSRELCVHRTGELGEIS